MLWPLIKNPPKGGFWLAAKTVYESLKLRTIARQPRQISHFTDRVDYVSEKSIDDLRTDEIVSSAKSEHDDEKPEDETHSI